MNSSKKPRITSAALVAFSAALLALTLDGVCAEPVVYESVASVGAAIQNEERTDPVAKPSSTRRASPPEDPNERDVAKRPNFVRELNEHRLNFGCFLDDRVLRTADERLAIAERARFLETCTKALNPDLRPEDPGLVIWLQRNLYPPEQGAVDWVVAEWRVHSLRIRASGYPGSDTFRVLVSIPSGHELSSVFPDHEPGANDATIGEDRGAMSHDVVASLLGPLTSAEAPLDGVRYTNACDRSCDGVHVRTFNVSRTLRHSGDAEESNNAAASERRDLVPTRLLVTDSDPQYVCLLFDQSQ